MNIKWNYFSKLGMLLVIIGFFMPISCSMNGFELSKTLISMGSEALLSGILLLTIFVTALLSILSGFILIKNRKTSYSLEVILLFICFLSGGYVYFTMFKQINILQLGAYVIIIGWLTSFLSLLLSRPQHINHRENKKNEK